MLQTAFANAFMYPTESVRILIQISLKYVSNGPIVNKLIQV